MRSGLLLFALLCATGLDVPVRAQNVAFDASADLESIGTTCIALAVFGHARGHSYFGQALVAAVVVNQVDALPVGADPCDAVMAPGHFPAVDAMPFPRAPWSTDAIAWAVAVDVAQNVFSRDYYIPPPFIGITGFAKQGQPVPKGMREVGAVDGLAFFAPVDALDHLDVAASGNSPWQ